MKLTICQLTPELARDYFDFFENRAFTDNSPYRCYCQLFQLSKDEWRRRFGNIAESELGGASRKEAERQIASGILRGYLAFADNRAVGWCNVNDKANFPKVSFNGAYDHFHAPVAGREKAVVCFEIAPELRGQGIATALLRRAVDDAATENYSAIEGFPEKRDKRFEWDFAGPVRLYEKAGFVRTAEHDGFWIMRKTLRRDSSA